MECGHIVSDMWYICTPVQALLYGGERGLWCRTHIILFNQIPRADYQETFSSCFLSTPGPYIFALISFCFLPPSEIVFCLFRQLNVLSLHYSFSSLLVSFATVFLHSIDLTLFLLLLLTITLVHCYCRIMQFKLIFLSFVIIFVTLWFVAISIMFVFFVFLHFYLIFIYLYKYYVI